MFFTDTLRSISPPERVWEIIASYANRDKDWPGKWQRAPWFATFPKFDSAFERTAFVLLGFASAPRRECRIAARDLEREHRDFTKMLVWLCTVKPGRAQPNAKKKLSGEPPLRSDVPQSIFRFIKKRAVDEFRERLTSPGGGYLPLRSGCDNAIGLLCRFVVEQAGEKMPGEIPLRICRRIGCGRFFVAHRGSAAFCSASCRAQHFWTRDKKKEYMRAYRGVIKKLGGAKIARR